MQVKRQALRGLEDFVKDMKCAYGVLVNRGNRIERLIEKIVRIPVQHL